MNEVATKPSKSASEPKQRRYLRPDEVQRLIKAAAQGRHGLRDTVLMRCMYRHGLRCSEATGLRWSQVDLEHGVLHVSRLKNGTPGTHPMDRDEVSGLRRLRASQEPGPYVFRSERGGPMSPDAVARLVRAAGVRAKLEVEVRPHSLRHATGYYMANEGYDTRIIQDYLGHRDIAQTVRYTQLSPARLASVMVR